MMVEWVRLWHDMPTDPKWRVIARKSGQPLPVVLSVFTMMLTNASANATERGVLENWNNEDIAAALDIDEADVAAVYEAMQGKVLDGLVLTGWEKRQPKREDSSAERAKAWRERNRTQPNATERPDTDTDTDTDTDISSLRSDRPAKPKDGAKPKRKSQIPADCPAAEDREKAEVHWRAKGRNDLDLDEQAEKFRAHHLARGSVMADWSAAWRTWYANAVSFERPRQREGPDAITAALDPNRESFWDKFKTGTPQ